MNVGLRVCEVESFRIIIKSWKEKSLLKKFVDRKE